MKTLAILGITGSIGTTALRGISEYSEEIKIIAASAYSNQEKAFMLCNELNIPNLCITSEYCTLTSSEKVRIFRGIEDMLSEIKPDMVLNGISGSAGLTASVSAISKGCKLALANKETVVLGGSAFFNFVKNKRGTVIPVDSEHSAIDELLETNGRENVSKLVITASGGPFLRTPPEELNNIKPELAVKHPTWNMGPKISIDSSTLANKGLEVIEAHFLFNFKAEDIEVVIHPQSIVHSMVRTASGQVYSQMSPPDMVFPIMRAILEKKYKKPVGKSLDFSGLELSFEKPDFDRFPFLSDAYDCIKSEGAYPAVYNIADEVAVKAFTEGKISFLQIRDTVRKALNMNWEKFPEDVSHIPSYLNYIRRRVTI